ncbi:short-subunit dehydrogenase [Stackebrandtia albiflava]|uniref:Short-subunit dehydrogenase n=1 Tax=Stackebrandtia albiflava TaxID=406432 RepID=A0A562VF11_9ACTN|nr:SDR family oxidoreductase [Stackebrandtia albiflava]TWJ16387.1 short-subunit dehydrogenase [Stackebrandtia albiflava]
MRITGSTVLITGASMGIGAAVAREFARHGATTLLAARSAERLRRLADRITADGGTAHAIPADVGTLDGATALVATVTEDHGTPDILVNNAGAGRFTHLDDTTPEEFAHMAAVPYLAAGYLTTGLLPAMVRRGSGRVVNVNSPVSRVVWPAAGGYASARWALRGLTEGLRADLAGTGVGVTEVVPGEVTSEYFTNNPGSAENLPAVSRILPRLSPEQVARRLVYAVAVERDEVIFPAALRLLAAQARLTPRLVARVVAAGRPRRRTP